MALHKVPGFKRYKADDAGFKEILNSQKMSAASLEVSQRIAGNANAVGDATYVAERRSVRAGWKNESRAGAVARVSVPHWRDSRDAVLVRVARAMAMRGQRD